MIRKHKVYNYFICMHAVNLLIHDLAVLFYLIVRCNKDTFNHSSLIRLKISSYESSCKPMKIQEVGHLILDYLYFIKKICVSSQVAQWQESACQCRRCRRPRFDPWVGKIPWRRKWQPTPGFLPGESHGQRSLAGYSPWGRTELDTTERVNTHTHKYLQYQIIEVSK